MSLGGGADDVHAELDALRAYRRRVDERLEQIMEIVTAVAARDYTARARTDDEDDTLNAVSVGLNMMTEELSSSSSLVGDILSAMGDAVLSIGRDGAIELANEAAGKMMGYPAGALVGRPFGPFVAGLPGGTTPEELLDHFGQLGGVEARLLSREGRATPVSLSISPMYGGSGELVGVVAVARDVSDQLRLQEELSRKAEMVFALSTPLLPIETGIVVMPLMGTIDGERAQRILESLLEGASKHGARVAILDITGVPIVDQEVANVILRAVRATRLVGAEVVLTGVRPPVAQALVALGIEMSGVVFEGTLGSGLSRARTISRRRG